MPTIVCRTCGRQVYTTAPLDSLFAEERRCPRCGAGLDPDRRTAGNRRHYHRRQNPPDNPGPPGDVERRTEERRKSRRRRSDSGPYSGS
jgi:hypothetical protein